MIFKSQYHFAYILERKDHNYKKCETKAHKIVMKYQKFFISIPIYKHACNKA